MSVKKRYLKAKFDRQKSRHQNKIIYINQNLCLYYIVLWPKSKSLQTKTHKFSYLMSNSTIKIKLEEHS